MPPITRRATPDRLVSNLLQTDTPPSQNTRTKSYIETDSPSRVRVITYRACGKTAAQTREYTGVPERTQRRILQPNAPYRRPGKERSGKPPAIDNRLLRDLIAYVRCNWETRTSKWQELVDEFKLNCTKNTVKKHLNDAGYYKCKACQKSYLREANVRKREKFARSNLRYSKEWWRRVRFTDEVHFNKDSRAAAWVIRLQDERSHEDCIQFNKRSHGTDLHCWAMVGYDYKSPIVFFDVNDSIDTDPSWNHVHDEQQPQPVKETEEEERRLLGEPWCNHRCKNKVNCKHKCCKELLKPKKGGDLTQEQYLEWIFKGYIEPVWRRARSKGEHFVLMEDNDNAHGTRTDDNSVICYKRGLGTFDWYANPPQSPDFNIIENVWRILKQRVKKYKPRIVDELRKAILYEWEHIEQEKINNLVDSMPRRLRQCWEREGLHTQF